MWSHSRHSRHCGATRTRQRRHTDTEWDPEKPAEEGAGDARLDRDTESTDRQADIETEKRATVVVYFV